MNVLRPVETSAVLWLFVSLTINPAVAQPTRLAAQDQTSQKRHAPVIAVVDLVQIFDQHPYFKANLAATRQQVREFELRLAEQKKSIAARSRHLNELRIDSAEYRKLETELARDVAQLRLWTHQRQQQLTREKAKHYYSAYLDIVSAIARVAQRRQIDLVLRISNNGQPPVDVRSIVRQINRPVVMQRNLDITQQVINELRTSTARLEPQVSSPRPSR